MRYVAKFKKGSTIKFISHLDLMRTIQRVIRRAKLPAEYSKGFNPHMTLSIAQPLSVGIYSDAEYMDLEMVEDITESEIMEKFNQAAPEGIKISFVKMVPHIPNTKKIPQLMALIEGAEYSINIIFKAGTDIKSKMEELLENTEWVTVKKSKKGEATVNIRPMVKEISYDINAEELKLNVFISCGSRENLSAELLSEYIRSSIGNYEENAFVDIKRKELYTLVDEKYVALDKFFLF